MSLPGWLGLSNPTRPPYVGPLDVVGSPILAYDASRSQTNMFKGPIVEAYRTVSPNDTQDIGVDAEFGFDVATFDTWAAGDPGAATTMYDHAGGASSALGVNLSTIPIIETSGLGAIGGASLNGPTSNLVPIPTTSTSNTYSICWVANCQRAAANQFFFSGANPQFRIYLRSSGFIKWDQSGFGKDWENGGDGFTGTHFFIATFTDTGGQFGNGESTLYVDGVQQELHAVFTKVEIGTASTIHASLTSPANGMTIYDRVLTTQEIADLSQNYTDYYGLNTEYDMFVGFGQSNMEGRGVSASSPTVPLHQGKEFQAPSTIINPIVDPVAGATTGSCWPAFANRYFALTGRVALVMDGAKGSAGLTETSSPGNSWVPTTGLAWTSGTGIADAAITDQGYNLKGIFWAGMEQDASEHNLDSGYTEATIQTAANVTFASFGTLYGDTPIFISECGNENGATPDDGSVICRTVQANLVAAFSKINWAWRGAPSKASSGVHYSQAEYDTMGEEFADAVVAYYRSIA